MIKNHTFAVIGGDLRQVYLANELAELGCRVYGILFDNNINLSEKVVKTNDFECVLPICDVIIFPLPVSLDGENINSPLSKYKIPIDDCVKYIAQNTDVFCGLMSEKIMEKFSKKSIDAVDYFNREELAILNAIPTAEGAVALAMQEIATTIYGTNCMITGYGRISKVLIKLLTAFGAKVKVVARKYSDLEWIKLYGCQAVPISELGTQVKDVDILFNTVPAVLLNEKILLELKKDCLVIDLASKPGGADM